MSKVFWSKIKYSKWGEFILFVINSYLLALLSWQIVHKDVDISSFYLKNIEPAVNNPFLSVKVFILIFIIFALIGFFIRLINNQAKSNLKLQFIIFIGLLIGINFQSIVGNLSLLNTSIFGIKLRDFFNQAWFWRNLIFVFIFSYYVVFYYVSPLGKRFRIKITKNIWIYLLIALAICAYSVMTIGKHNNLKTNTMDLGGYDQAIWKFSRFEAPLSTIYADQVSDGDVDLRNYSSEERRQFFPNILGDHFEPILALLAPIYWVINDVRFLLFIQALIVSLGAWPIYMLGKEKLKSVFAGLAIASTYLFFIGIQTAMEFDFHPLIFLAPILAYLYYFIDKKRYLWVYVFTVLALLTKEVASIYIFFFGVYAFFIKKERKLGLVLMGLGILWYILVVNLIIPYGFGRHYGHISAYDALGTSALGIIKTVFTNPFYVLNILFTPGNKITTWFSIFGSTGFLAILSPSTLLLAIPMIGEKFLTLSKASVWTVWWHYTATITPIIMIAAINGIQNLKEKFKHIHYNWAVFGSLVVFISTMSISFIFHNNPDRTTPLSRIFNSDFYKSSQDIIDFQEIEKLIPDDASLATTDTLLPHLAHRQEIYRVHPTVPNVDYVIINTYEGFWPWKKEDILRLVEELKKNQYYNLKINKGNVYLFEKR